MSDKSGAACGSCNGECSVPDLEEICRAHGIDPAVIGDEKDIVSVLDRMLEAMSRKRRDEVLSALEAELEARERRQIESIQEMMQALGSLSHKINNPLTSLLGRAQLLRVGEDTDPKTRRAAEVIEDSAKRIAGYIRELAGVISQGNEQAAGRLREMQNCGDD
jgi:signal transduction histidine kinase